MSPSFRITPPYDLLLRGSRQTPVGMYHLQLTTADQLTRLHYKPGTLKTVKRRLKQLVDQRYITADVVPKRYIGAPPYFYSLTPKGLRYLKSIGMDTNEAHRPHDRLKHTLFIEHVLELNDVLIAAALLAHSTTGYYLHGFTHEQVLKRRPYTVTVQQHGRRVFNIIPDAVLDFRRPLLNGGYRYTPVLLEHDRGTEQQQYFRQRIRAYIAFLTSGIYQELFNTSAVNIAFTTFEGVRRREQMRAWTLRELKATTESPDIGLAFSFAALQRPLTAPAVWLDPCWLSPYDNEEPHPLLAF
jgi:DNA-binding PadR family transcriptional regulator